MLFLLSLIHHSLSSDVYPWTYENDVMGGPGFWGLMLGKENEMCSKGKLQSPIDIRPERLLFDFNLKPLHIDQTSVMSELVNTGQMPRVRIGNSVRYPSANVSGGPLLYTYRIQRIDIHFGREKLNGSEHTIDGKRFPMEIQMLAYNTELYSNFSQASKSPRGLAGISVMVDFGDETTDELLKLTIASASILNKEQRVELAELQPWRLFPKTRDFVTYDGSMTSPGCHETVTWIIANKPIFITKDHWNEWGKMLRHAPADKSEDPQYLAPNCRAQQELYHRLVRTNIQYKIKARQECRNITPKILYRANPVLDPPRHKRRHHHMIDF